MSVLVAIAVVTLVAAAIGFVALSRWSPELAAPRLEAAPQAAAEAPAVRPWLQRRTDPATLTGALLTTAALLVIGGLAGVGLLLLMVRRNDGFARWDLSAARFGAHHATALSTDVLRAITQLGGSVVLVPVAVVVAIVTAARRSKEWPSIVGFLVLCIGGQFLVANTLKLLVSRARPNLDRLTGFSSSSFPSGHSTAAAASFAAFAFLLGRGRSRRARVALGTAAIAGTAMVASSRVLLGVHWLTDVMAGACLGWAWFALSSIAFGGRLLSFGQPVAEAQAAADPVVGGDARTDVEASATRSAARSG